MSLRIWGVICLAAVILAQARAQYEHSVLVIGCYADRDGHRDLTGDVVISSTMTQQHCLNYCTAKGFAYAGVQNSRYCYCGNKYGTYGKIGTCNVACAGDARINCGGASANLVLRKKPPVVAFSVALTSDLATAGIIRYNHVIMNDGRYYDVNTGKFTAPEEGVYHFDISAYSYGAYSRLFLVRNGRSVLSCDGTNNQISNSGIFSLKKGETVWVHMSQGRINGIRNDMYGVATYPSTFTGFKLGYNEYHPLI